MASDFLMIVYLAGIITGIAICWVIAIVVKHQQSADHRGPTQPDPTAAADWWKTGQDGPPEWEP